MKNPEKYFEKNGFIFGLSWKDSGMMLHREMWCDWYVKKFTNFAEAEAWLCREEYDFREREFITKTEAIREWGFRD